MTTRSARLILEADSRQLRTAKGDLSALERQAADTERSAGRMSRGFGISTRAIAAGAAVAGTALAAMVRNVANSGDELAKLSQRTGVAVEDLSRLQFAAELSDVSNQQLADGFKFLARSMSDTARGTGEAQHAFAAMGIEVKNADGSLRDSVDVLGDVADKFASYEDGAQKSALAQKIFGRSGAELIPLLNQGAAGLKRMGDESDRLGRTMSGELARASEEFNDNLTRIKGGLTGLSIQIAGPAIRSLVEITNAFMNAQRAGDGFFKSLFQAITMAPQVLDISPVVRRMQEVNEELQTTKDPFARRRAEIELRQLTERYTELSGAAANAARSIQTTNRVAPPSMSGDGGEGGKSGGGAGRTATIRSETDAIQRQVDALVLQAQTLGMAESQAVMFRLQLEGATQAQLASAAAALEVVDAFRLQEEAKAKDIQRSIELEQQATSYYENTRTAAERLTQELAVLDELLREGKITWDTYTRAVFDAEDKFDSLKQKIPEVTDELDRFRATAAERLQGVFADALTDPFSGSLEEMGRKWSQMLQRMAAEALAAKLTESLFGQGTGGGGFLASLGSFFGFKALGGNIPAGGWGVAGDRGRPEIVKGPATVVSGEDTAKMAGGGRAIRIINAFDPSVVGDWLGSTAGEETVMNIVRRNQSAFAEV